MDPYEDVVSHTIGVLPQAAWQAFPLLPVIKDASSAASQAVSGLSENIANIFNTPEMAVEAGTLQPGMESLVTMMMGGKGGGGRLYGKGQGRKGRPTRAEQQRQLQDLAKAKRLKELEARQSQMLVPPGGELVAPEAALVTQNPLTNMVEEFEAKVVALEDYFDSIKEKSFEPDKAWNEQKGLSETIPKGIIDPHEQVPRQMFDWRSKSDAALAEWSARSGGMPDYGGSAFKWRRVHRHPEYQLDKAGAE